jgi:hypothetical protein
MPDTGSLRARLLLKSKRRYGVQDIEIRFMRARVHSPSGVAGSGWVGTRGGVVAGDDSSPSLKKYCYFIDLSK